ncbi:oxygen-independent coproporphyrinogen III oxidase [Formosa algae]|uniref:Coproporphyrinogen-III oxidase n=2 Tax=Formosa algae TaxID=225843 RepID=A0A9X0YJR1_9FLAO|nr:oxygen-independent coproporphyrinogen III oxidase [Formosa algae]MBP1838146.1 oxygen-independent coproporphyrinogen-3 oxidase [Formosa algae]MDQ0334281.1 oxygen-independent coproporphyrinogen-3 oxidase [Formosa algae]
MHNLIQKYNIPGPRYTSYPTVPYWDQEGITLENWIATLKKSFKESNTSEGISLYIHLPFCESLCTFCACNKRITKQHSVEVPYIDMVLKEWSMYCEVLEDKPNIKEIHLGGGTPTFFSSENLKKLIHGIFETANKAENFEFSFEGHPNFTTTEQLQVLFDLGFTRNSFGIQDYDPKVQKAIHRVQSFEAVQQVTEDSRTIGYNSVSHDLIFGLPFQTEESIRETIKKTVELKPDRIAYYSYAHVPWIKGNGQRGFKDTDLPQDHEKRALYELGKQLFFDAGYVEIGMDHFALPTDSMYTAMESKTLHRNFMGYTSGKTKLMIGLGVSSISDSWYSFAQNEKNIDDYYARLRAGELPIFRGHLLSNEDLVVRQHILNIMCNLETSWKIPDMLLEALPEILSHLKEMEADGILNIFEDRLVVKEEGRMFIRNVCMAFDLKLHKSKPETKLFSMTI